MAKNKWEKRFRIQNDPEVTYFYFDGEVILDEKDLFSAVRKVIAQAKKEVLGEVIEIVVNDLPMIRESQSSSSFIQGGVAVKEKVLEILKGETSGKK
jgi:hypothetical protein